MLDVCAAVAHHLGAQVEARDRFEVDGDAFFGPFPLCRLATVGIHRTTHPSKLVALHGFRFAAAEPALVDQIRQILRNHGLNLGHGLFQSLLGLARNVEVQWRFLLTVRRGRSDLQGTYRGRRHALVREVIATGGDIL